MTPGPRAIRRRLACWSLTVVGVALAAPSSAGPRVTLETLEGETAGELLAIDEVGEVTLRERAASPFGRNEVLSIRYVVQQRSPGTEEPPSGVVTLVDGSTLPYRVARVTDAGVTLELLSSQEESLAVATAGFDAIRTWRRFDRRDQAAEEAWADSLDAHPAADTLLVRSRSGRRVTAAAGVLVALDATGVRFALDGTDAADAIALPWGRVVGMRFYRSGAVDAQPGQAEILAAGGLRVYADRLTADEQSIDWSSPLASGRAPHADLVRLDPSVGRVVAVADLPLLSASWSPYFEEQSPAKKRRSGHAVDKALGGQPLTLRFVDPRVPEAWPRVAVTRRFDQGVALRSRGELRLEAPADARLLVGWIGLDPAARRVGDAAVEVLADQRVLWRGGVNGATAPVELRVPLDGERELTLRVGFGDNLDAGDRVHFADFKVVR